MVAEEILEQEYDSYDFRMAEWPHGETLDMVKSAMIKFAKLHVVAALEAAAKNAIDSETIKNAYSLENIK